MLARHTFCSIDDFLYIDILLRKNKQVTMYVRKIRRDLYDYFHMPNGRTNVLVRYPIFVKEEGVM